MHWETQYRRVGCGRAVVYQETQHRAAKQGLPCLGAPIQTKASAASRTVCDYILYFPRASISKLKTSSFQHLPSSSLGFPNTPRLYIASSLYTRQQFFPSCVGSRHTRFQLCPHCYVGVLLHSATNRISSDPIDHTCGRASIVDGCIVYSPNCGRIVKMPPMFPNIDLLLNTGQPIDCLHQPLWWSKETAFLAFLPIDPEFAGVPFEDFNHPELQKFPTEYFMRAEASLTWKCTKFILRVLAQSFIDTYGIPQIKSWRAFSKLLSSGAYQYPSQFQRKLKWAKGWLSLYMAILAYVIAVAQEIDKDDPGDDTRPTWFLKMDQYDQILLSGLRSCTAYTYFLQRVGIFLKIVEPPTHQVTIDFLIKYCVPVWYRWGPEEISKAKHDHSVDHLAPPLTSSNVLPNSLSGIHPPSPRIQIVPGLDSSKNVRRICCC